MYTWSNILIVSVQSQDHPKEHGDVPSGTIPCEYSVLYVCLLYLHTSMWW